MGDNVDDGLVLMTKWPPVERKFWNIYDPVSILIYHLPLSSPKSIHPGIIIPVYLYPTPSTPTQP